MMAQVTYIRIFFSLTSFMHLCYYPLHFNLILSGIIMYKFVSWMSNVVKVLATCIWHPNVHIFYLELHICTITVYICVHKA